MSEGLTYLTNHWGMAVTLLGGVAAITTYILKGVDFVAELLIKRLLANPKLHYILEKYEDQILEAIQAVKDRTKADIDQAKAEDAKKNNPQA